MTSLETDIAASDTGTVTLDITGMHCAACAARVEKVLLRVPGVRAAAVNLALDRADVGLGTGIDVGKLVEAVTTAGYGAAPRGGDAAVRRQANAARDTERRADERRTLVLFVLASLLTLPFLIDMAIVWIIGGHGFLTTSWQLTLALPVQLVCGAPFYRRAWQSVRGGSASMDVLIVLGTSAAFLYSLSQMWLGGMQGHSYFEGAAAVITFVLFGRVLEARAKAETLSALTALSRDMPAMARRLSEAGEEEVPVEAIAVGDHVVIRSGDRVPVDGQVLEGAGEIDESLITGESLPVVKQPGDRVVAGSLNGNGRLIVVAIAVGEDVTLARIARLVEDAQLHKAPVQLLADRISAIFVPVVIGLAVAAFAGWLAIGGGLPLAMKAAISVLVIACPCALGLATPIALVAGTGAAARAGIVVRDLAALQAAATIDTVVFDKTGTLTVGRPELAGLFALSGKEEGALAFAAALASGSDHPLGQAVLAAAGERHVFPLQSAEIATVPGGGMIGTVAGKSALLGSTGFLSDHGIAMTAAEAWLEKTGHAAGAPTLSWLAIDHAVVAAFSFRDTVRQEAAKALSHLNEQGIGVVILSGDREIAAKTLALELHVTDWRAELKPDGKVAALRALRAEDKHLMMIGDGINDAPALAVADVGVAMGSGTQAALAAAGITLMRPDLLLVPALIELARATRRCIAENLGLAFLFNGIGLPLAALGLLTPGFAGAAMALSSVSVVANAWRLSRWRMRSA